MYMYHPHPLSVSFRSRGLMMNARCFHMGHGLLQLLRGYCKHNAPKKQESRPEGVGFPPVS